MPPPPRRFALWTLAPGWACAALLLAIYPLFPYLLDRYQFLPFVLGMAFLGLPHGAQDHLVVPRLRGERVTLPFLAKFVAGYGALVLLYLAFWKAWPAGALGTFLVYSLLHWGQGDAFALSTFAHVKVPASAFGRGLVWLVRGGLPIALSSLAFPNVFSHVTAGIAAPFGGHAGFTLTHTMQTTGLAALAALTLLYLAQSWRLNGCRRTFVLDAGEVALLGLLFWRVPPVLAVGVYFCAWHALRHVGRLVLLDPIASADGRRGQVAQAFGRAARDSFPMTAVSLVMLAALYAALPHRVLTAESATYLYLSLIAALTFPHFLLVLWMDRQQKATKTTAA